MNIIESALAKKEEKGESKSKPVEEPSVKRHSKETTVTQEREHSSTHEKENVAFLSSTVKKYSDAEYDARSLIYPRMKDQEIFNSYRALRTRLIQNSTKDCFVTMVTSVVDDWNSCYVSANLAVAFALTQQHRGLIVDGDIVNSKVSEIFEMKNRPGILEFFEQENASIENYISESPVHELFTISCGVSHQDSRENFSSEKMKSFRDELFQKYPRTSAVVHAPAIKNSADAVMLMEMCDYVVLVVPYGKATTEEIKEAKGLVPEEKFKGFVLDGF